MAKVITGFCMKCKTTRNILGPKLIKMANGRPATKGKCTVCSTNMFKIGGN